MATASTNRYEVEERAGGRGEGSRRSGRRGRSLRDDIDEPEHVPVCEFIWDNFPLLTANENFRFVYDYVATIYLEIKNSFIVNYIVGWILAFLPLLNPAFLLARFWYWTVWKLIVKPLYAFWKKVGAVIGVNAVIIALWKRTLQMIDYCGNYLIDALASVYIYVRTFWQQIMHDYAVVMTQITDQASETLKTIVRLVKILYSYVQQLGNLILSDKVEKIIVWTALAIYSVAKWFYHLNKIYQNTCDSAIKIIIDTWNENSVEVPSQHSKDTDKASSSVAMKSSAGHAASAAHGSLEPATPRDHEVAAEGRSHHEETPSHHKE